MIMLNKLNRISLRLLVLAVMFAVAFSAYADNWSRWRGPNDNGSVTSGNYSVKWDPENVLWKIDVPGKGFSTPVVWNNKIYLTTGAKDTDTVLAFDWSGKQLWQKQLGPEVAGRHPNASGCNPSATTDGTAVFVFFKSGNFASPIAVSDRLLIRTNHHLFCIANK